MGRMTYMHDGKWCINGVNGKLTGDNQTMLCKLRLIQNDVSRIDKRQLRVWQQLKKLLGIQPEE